MVIVKRKFVIESTSTAKTRKGLLMGEGEGVHFREEIGCTLVCTSMFDF
jgi:hypothetical protein